MENRFRDQRIDSLRGLALLFIILVNVNTFNSPTWMQATGFAFQKTSLDHNL